MLDLKPCTSVVLCKFPCRQILFCSYWSRCFSPYLLYWNMQYTPMVRKVQKEAHFRIMANCPRHHIQSTSTVFTSWWSICHWVMHIKDILYYVYRNKMDYCVYCTNHLLLVLLPPKLTSVRVSTCTPWLRRVNTFIRLPVSAAWTIS